ncbi:hypothetical protein SETIT_2G022500v2 [Setaria italica]|uniref:Protein kinase domain-containing protein n=1 Tax=Setaria italica TaxID=4555 RepID=A0A368PUG1_SETIT|nr:hypothetical protein SETIT_2G022500v2 [Setaria italica]
MACEATNKIGLPPVQSFFTILLIICPLFFSHFKPCTCSSSNQNRIARYSWNITFEQMNQGLLFRRGDGSSVTLQPGSLGYYMRNSSQLGFNLTDPGWFVIPKWSDPWKTSRRGDERMDLHEASFSIVFTLTVESLSTLLFDILPRLEPPSGDPGYFTRFKPMSFEPVKIDTLENTAFHSGRTIRTVPDEATLQLDARDALSPDGLVLALSSTMGQLLQLHTWSFTIEFPETVHSQGPNTVTILSSVLGSAAAASAIAAAVYLYLNSKYRRWKKDLDQLSKNMQCLPGVPMQVDFADIRKATNNFHESTRLGQGGFGAVYRCRLPAAKKGEFMEVAVKKFTRADNRGYEDFLAEVFFYVSTHVLNNYKEAYLSIILAHFYFLNKYMRVVLQRGEPILIYEHMPNGSLDQQLFSRSGDEQQSCIHQWGTRYNIVRDIATGLQYVHHEYEPMVLHRDIKASNILIDLTFQARLGDFGLACVLADGKNSYTDHGAHGTIGFRSPEYIYNGRATRKTDVFAFGVLVLEIVAGKRAVGRDDVQFGHVTDWAWKLHAEGGYTASEARHGVQQPEPGRPTEHGGCDEDHRQVGAAAGHASFQAADGVATGRVGLSDI